MFWEYKKMYKLKIVEVLKIMKKAVLRDYIPDFNHDFSPPNNLEKKLQICY